MEPRRYPQYMYYQQARPSCCLKVVGLILSILFLFISAVWLLESLAVNNGLGAAVAILFTATFGISVAALVSDRNNWMERKYYALYGGLTIIFVSIINIFIISNTHLPHEDLHFKELKQAAIIMVLIFIALYAVIIYCVWNLYPDLPDQSVSAPAAAAIPLMAPATTPAVVLGPPPTQP